MPTFPHLGQSFYFEDDGTGPPLIAIPGMMSDSASWAPVVPALTACHRLIRPDPRCAGRSPVRPTSVEAVAADIIALMDHLKLERAHVLSHSMGSRVALELAQQHPARVDHVVLMGVMPRFPNLNCAVFESLLRVRELCSGDSYLRALFPWLFAGAFFDDPARTEDALAASLAYPYAQSIDGMRHQVNALKQAVPVQGLRNIRAPILALFGYEDRLVPVTTAPTHLADLPNCETRVVDGAGHALHWDQPDIVAGAVLDFIGRAA